MIERDTGLIPDSPSPVEVSLSKELNTDEAPDGRDASEALDRKNCIVNEHLAPWQPLHTSPFSKYELIAYWITEMTNIFC